MSQQRSVERARYEQRISELEARLAAAEASVKEEAELKWAARKGRQEAESRLHGALRVVEAADDGHDYDAHAEHPPEDGRIPECKLCAALAEFDAGENNPADAWAEKYERERALCVRAEEALRALTNWIRFGEGDESEVSELVDAALAAVPEEDKPAGGNTP